MTESFANLKRNRKSLYDKIKDESVKQNSSKRETDDRFWTPTVDKAGNGYAVIRFLPAPKGEDIPWVRLFNHGFQGPGGWYIENSLTTINQPDPCTEYNSMLWNKEDSDSSPYRKQARDQKRRLNYISNIMVVEDSENPDAVGKVFLYRYGKKIFDKLNEKMHPQFKDETPMNPFDFWEGANFKLKIRQVKGYRNYDSSEFDAVAAINDDDSELEKLWGMEYSLQEIIAPSNFKQYAELKTRLNRVLGLDTSREINSSAEDVPTESMASAPRSKAPKETAEADVPWDESNDEDPMAQFMKLAED